MAEVTKLTIYPLPWFSTASGQKLIWFAAPSGLHTFPPICQCGFFHYQCLNTDSLIYGHLGLVKVSKAQTHQTQASKWQQLSRLVGGRGQGGYGPVFCPWRNMPVVGASPKGAHFGDSVSSMVSKDIIFLRVGGYETVVPKCCSVDCFWCLTRDETLVRTVLYLEVIYCFGQRNILSFVKWCGQ